MAGAAAPRSQGLPPGLRGLRGLPGRRRAERRPAAPALRAMGQPRTLDARPLRRAGLHAGLRRQRRAGHAEAALRLLLHDHAQLDLRARHADRGAHASQAAARARLRSRRLRHERVWATARDGARVPVSLVYRKGFARNGTALLYQTGYGSYGFALDPKFDSTIVSLLDRGFVYAIAH